LCSGNPVMQSRGVRPSDHARSRHVAMGPTSHRTRYVRVPLISWLSVVTVREIGGVRRGVDIITIGLAKVPSGQLLPRLKKQTHAEGVEVVAPWASTSETGTDILHTGSIGMNRIQDIWWWLWLYTDSRIGGACLLEGTRSLYVWDRA
jgi:hypothetical protein